MSSARSFPLVGKSFYFDIPSGKNLDFLAKNVKRLGGVIESFLSKEVTYLVSSTQEAREKKWAGKHTQTGALPSGGPQRDHRSPLPKPVDTALISRGKKLLHKAIGTQDNAPGNSILISARLWGVQIIHTDEMLTYIRRLSKKQSSKAKLCASGYKPRKVMTLRPHFLKIEDKSRQLRPLLKHFKKFPQLYFLAQRKHSPFEPPRTSTIAKHHRSQGSANGASPLSDGCFMPQKQKGYCECCERSFTELWSHLHSPQHKEFAADPSHYTYVDSIISQLTNDFAFSCTPPLRVPAATGNGEHFGLLMEVNENTTISHLDQTLQHCVSAEGSVGQFDTLGGSTRLFEDQGFLQLTATPLEVFNPPVQFALESPESISEQNEEGRVLAKGNTQAVAPAEVKNLAHPTAASHKRKHSSSPFEPAKKKQALASDERQSSTDLDTGEHQVGILQWLLPNVSDGQAAPRHPGPFAVPSHAPSHLCTPPQLPLKSCSCHLSEPVAIDTEYLKSPMQQLDQEEESIRRHGTCAVSFPCNFPGPNTGLRGTPDFPPGIHIAPKLLGSRVQHSSPPKNELAQTVLPQQPDPRTSPCLYLPSNQLTEESSSSISEWDGPLLGALAGPSYLPSEGLVDAALLGTCVSVQDSNYESHLCSVLWQTPQQNLS